MSLSFAAKETVRSVRPSRRCAARFPSTMSVTCYTGTAPLPGRLRTLSLGGLSLALPRIPEPVPFLTVELTNARTGTSRRYQVRVLYALRSRIEGCIVGLSFPKKLDGEELRSLVS
jgi:hypothetical protein